METENQQNIRELRGESREYITWKIFIWVIGIIVAVIGTVFSYLSVRVSAIESDVNLNNVEFAKVQVQLTNVIQLQNELKVLLQQHIAK